VSRRTLIERTADGKTCGTCEQMKPWSSFGKNRATEDGHRHECRDCRNAALRALPSEHPVKEKARERHRQRYANPAIREQERIRSRARYHAKPDIFRERHRKEKLKREFGITVEEWDALFSAQGGRCAICGTDDFKGRRPHTDHCHATGEVRGLLCKRCNQGVGFFVDDPGLMRGAAEYIERSHKKRAA
jgi:hypothetical protein